MPQPPLNHATARSLVHTAERAWNARDPHRVARASTLDARWRDQGEVATGRDAIAALLIRKWQRELHYRTRFELWAWSTHRLAVRTCAEWQDAQTGQWYRTHGKEFWEVDGSGRLQQRDASAHATAIGADQRHIGFATTNPTPKEHNMKTRTTFLTLILAALLIGGVAHAQLPDPGVELVAGRTAVVITDPQNDFLSPDGVTWGVVGKSVTQNNTVANIESLFKAAKANDVPVFVSPHYYYPTDHGWQFEGALEALMHKIGMFDRQGPLTTKGFENSGADWLARYKPYIEDGKTVVSNPHKVYGPETNDLVLQLRKRGVDKVILGGMSANLCTESHMRELLEQGFEVAVVSDATAAAIVEEGNGYESALVNFRFIANTVWTTEQAVSRINAID